MSDDRNRQSEDFEFMVMCAAKGNMGMYHLFRDRSLDRKYTEINTEVPPECTVLSLMANEL